MSEPPNPTTLQQRLDEHAAGIQRLLDEQATALSGQLHDQATAMYDQATRSATHPTTEKPPTAYATAASASSNIFAEDAPTMATPPATTAHAGVTAGIYGSAFRASLFSPDPDDPAETHTHRPAARRYESIFLRQQRSSTANATPLNMLKMQPDFSHIKLTQLELRPVYEFLCDVFRYQNSHRVSTPVSTLVSQKCIDAIILEEPGLSEEGFHAYNAYQIQTLLQRKVRPKTREEFTHNMETLADFGRLPHSSTAVSLPYAKFYELLASYKTTVFRYFEIQSADNEENIPETCSKTKGLAKVFASKIPFDYGFKLVDRITRDTRVTDLYVFLKTFFAEVTIDKKRSAARHGCIR
jgi:hypothetical protein